MTLFKLLAGIILLSTQGDTTKYYLYEKDDVGFYSTTYEFSYPQISGEGETTGVNQTYSNWETSEVEDSIKVFYKIPARLEGLIILDHNTEDMIDGYRVQIYAGASLESADGIRGEFMDLYPRSNSYRRYIRPTFRIRVGDFNSRKDASNFCSEIRKFFPGAFVVPEKIPSPRVRKPQNTVNDLTKDQLESIKVEKKGDER